ncbi:DnaJ family domain-containing protein [Nocardia vermiculata]|uniref:DUF1992 domain-containing protein n=1 Tax=Nocardia vermiculata TaxID=257274 RepID=A0A846Y4K6_9NOCA|nr:DUF1992 domain-containing protein [Nocardia vermiculata]NKY52784.1 DUF1992 domain-containing protein [Nocardia vermiculata]
MTERKPAGMQFESWIDKQVREATERGEFDNLPGAGKPLPGTGDPYDENWWLKNYLHREGVGGDGLLPTSLVLRRDLERLPDTVAAMNSEAEVREYVADLNSRIVDWVRMPHGPQVRVAPVHTADVVENWRSARRSSIAANSARPAAETSAARTPTAPARARRSWWRRLLARG